MGSLKGLRGPTLGFWAWLLCGIATGAALPVATEPPATEDDYSMPNFLSTVVFADYFGPTLPTTTEEDLDFPAETPFPSEANGEDDSGSLATTPKTFKIPEDLKEISEVPSVDKNVLHPVNSSQPTLGKASLQGESLAESQEAPKETPPLDLEAGHEATELITERYSGVTEAPVNIFATSEEDPLASPSKEEAQTEILSTSPPEGEKPLENIPGEPNLDEERKPTSTSWEETEASPLEAEKDTPEPSTDESGGTLEDPSSNPPVFPSIPEDLPDQETGENVDAPSLSSEGGPETSTGLPPVWPLPTRENVGSPGINDLDVGSLQPSPAGVDSGSPVGRGDADPIPSSSSEPNQASPVNMPREEPEGILDAEASDSSPSDDAPSDSGPPGDTLVRTSPLDASDIPLGGLSGTPEIPSQLSEDGEIGAVSTVKEEGANDLGNPKSDEGTSPGSPFPGQESGQGTEIPDEERSDDLGGTTSSLNPGVEAANSELEDSEATTTSNSLPEDEINPIPSDLATGNKSGALFDTMVSFPPPVENEGADQAQEPPAEAQGPPAEASDPASTGGPSSETEGNEASPNESPGNIGSSWEEVDTEATSKDFSPPDTELSSSSGTLLPMERLGSLDDERSPSQSLVENAPTSGSSSSSEGEPTFPSTSPNEALSGSLISEPDTTELPSNLLPGSQPSSQLPKENDMEMGSGDVEDPPPPPPVDNEGADQAQEPPAEAQGSPAEASDPASTGGPSSETEVNEASPNESPGNVGSSWEEVDTEATSKDFSPPDTEFSSSSGTLLPMERSGPLDDERSPSQSLVENAPTSGSSSSSEGEPTFPSTSPNEALSGSLISEPDTTELPSNLLPGSQTSSQLPKENDMETGSGDVEDPPPSPPMDNEGAANAQGPPAEAQGSPAETSAPGSTNEPPSEREGSEVLPSGSPGNMGSSSENDGPIPSVSSDEVDTQANGEDHSVSDLPPSDTELSSISGIPLATSSSQPPKEDDVETHSEDPEDSVSINGEETSSAPSIINPQSALAEEEPSISGDLSNGPILSPKEEKIGSTSEPGVDEEPLVDGDGTQHKFNASSSEQQLSSEDALDTSIPSSGNEPAVQSGTISPLVDTETSTKTEEPSAEKSSASIEDILPNSENEDGESSPGLSSKTLDSSPGGDGIDESRDEEDDARSASSAQTAIATSNDGQPGSDFPVRQLVTSPVGGILALAPIEDGETSVPREDAQLSTGAVSSEDATPQPTSSAEETETSASEPSAVGSRPSPDGEAAPETSKETGQLQTSVASEKVSPLASSTTESQGPTASESGEFSGALNHGSAAFPVEVVGTANSPPATDKGSQVLPEGVASSDGVEDSEEITNMISEKSSQDPLDRGAEIKTSTSEEDAEGRIDGELSLNNSRTETATLESANNGGSQPPPDGAQLSATAGSSEISEGASGVNGKEGSLIPSVAELHSTSEEVENANSESRTHPESKPSLDGSPTTEIQDSKSAEAIEDTSNNGEKLSWTLSSTASQSPGISGGEDISGGTDSEESSLIGEELETAGPGATNNAEAQPSMAGGATETSDVSNRLEQLGNSSSANEGDTSLGSSATKSSMVLEDLEVSGKPSGGDGVEAINSELATNTEPPSSPNGVGPGGATVSEEAGTPEVSRTSDGSSTASAPEPQAISSSNEEETSNTATNAGSQLPLDGESAAGTPLPNGAEISEVSSSVPEEKGPLSPSTQESLEDSSSIKEVGTASRKSTTDEGSQLSAGGTSPEDSLASEGAEPMESHPIASGDQDSLVPPATELQFPETSANENLLGGLENGQSSLSPGEEADNAGSSNNVGSPDSVATEGEGAEMSEDNSIVSEKQLSVAPLSTEPQSPGTSVSKDVSENLVNAEASLSTDGGKEITNIGTAGAQGPTSSTGTGPDQNNIAEQFGENSDSMSGQSSVDGAIISKSSEETSISSSVSSGGNLAAQGMSQDVGAPDSSQPSSDNQGNLANSINDGNGENSVLGDRISTGDTLGVSNGPILEAGGEVLQGFSEALDSVSNLVHPSSAKGTKPAAGQLLRVVSPLASLPPKNGLLSAPSNLAGPKLGNVVGKGSSPLTPLLSSKPEVPATASELASGKPGLQLIAGSPLLSSKPEVPAKASKLASGKPGLQLIAGSPLLSSKPEVPAKASKLASGKPGLQVIAGSPLLSPKPEVPAEASKLASGKPGLQLIAGSPLLSSKPEVPAKASKLASGKPGLQVIAGSPLLSPKPEVPAEASKLASGKPGLQLIAGSPLLSSKPEVPAKASKLASGKPGLQVIAGSPLLSPKPEVPAEASKLASGKPGLQVIAGSPLLSSKPEVPAKASKLASGKPGLQAIAGSPLLSSKPEVPAKASKLASGKPGLQLIAGSPLLSPKPEVPAKASKLASGKPGLQVIAGSPLLSSKPEVPAKASKLASGKPGLQAIAGSPLLSSKPEVPAKASKLASGKPGLQLIADSPLLSSKPEVPAKASKLASGKPGLQLIAGSPLLSSKPEVPAKASKLASGKPGLQLIAGSPLLSSKPEVPAKASKLASGKPGLQVIADSPLLSPKPEVPAKASKLASGKPGLQVIADSPLLSSKPEVPAKASKLASGKPGLQLIAGSPLLSSKPEVPAKASELASGKPGLQVIAGSPLLSFKTTVPEEMPLLPSVRSGVQLIADSPLLSFNSDILANSEHILPGKPGPASPDSSSASDENDEDSSSGPNLSEEHQTFMKGKVALDLSKAKTDGSEPGVHLALSGVGLLAAKSSKPTSKPAKKKSDSKKSKDKKTKPVENSAIMTGAPSGAAVSLYPYGASVNDNQYVERKVDFNSPLFKPETGIPLGKSLRNSLYFTDNGQIVFPASDQDISSYPNPPSGGFNGREKVPMVAVFWDNADFSKGAGTIFYQEYPCGNSAKDPLVQDVEEKIHRYVKSSYRARWLLKVTWDKVQPYPAQRQKSKTNTYQAILTTDGYRTYTLFLYQDGGMQWDYTKLSAPNVLIGYTSGDGYFKNDNLMTRTSAEKYRPDRFQGYNTDVRGLWIYKLDSWIRVNYRQRCLDWLSHEKLPSAWNRNLPPCPCFLQQGMSDNRYTTSQKGWQDSGLTLLYSSRPNNYGAGVRCLYNRNGQLQEGRQERIWKNSRKNYPNNDEELKLHDWCCNKAGIPQTCEKYDQKRPRIGCQGYKPSIWG